jgi:hypothetical protein
MGFRFQRRIGLGGGWGLNTSGSGGSLSYRSRQGSIGTKGFSLRTGIPGLSYRQNWGKNAGSAALIIAAFMLALAAVTVSIKLLAYLVPLIWNCLMWIVLTVYDLSAYGVKKMEAWRSGAAAPKYSIVRDALIGAVVCGVVCIVFLRWTSNIPATAAPVVASGSLTQKDSADARGVGTLQSASKGGSREGAMSEAGALPAKATSVQADDDLAKVRAVDTSAAARIEAYCVANYGNDTSRHAAALARCRRRELAAWMRLYLYNEFPALSPDVRSSCRSPPVPESFAAEESCARTAASPDRPH